MAKGKRAKQTIMFALENQSGSGNKLHKKKHSKTKSNTKPRISPSWATKIPGANPIKDNDDDDIDDKYATCMGFCGQWKNGHELFIDRTWVNCDVCKKWLLTLSFT